VPFSQSKRRFVHPESNATTTISMKTTTDINQFSHVEKLATLTQLYLELRLPLHDALRAAEADL
jgi:hypothetical protein